MIELDKEIVEKIIGKANNYSNAMVALHKMAMYPSPARDSYTKGVIDGVENTSYAAFMAGAKAMYSILTKNEQTN